MPTGNGRLLLCKYSWYNKLWKFPGLVQKKNNKFYKNLQISGLQDTNNFVLYTCNQKITKEKGKWKLKELVMVMK